MDVHGLIDVHVNNLLLIFVIVKRPALHAILIIPAGRVHAGWVFVYLFS